MSVIPLSKENFEVYTIEGRPSRTFSSGSNGITGSVNPFGKNSSIERTTVLDQSQGWNETQIQNTLDGISKSVKNNPSNKNISPGISDYLYYVKQAAPTIRATKQININRYQFYPKTEETLDSRFSNVVSSSIRNSQIKNTLMPYYRTANSSGHYAYTNYHTLNFFTASKVPSNTAILYPNYIDTASTNGYASGSYNLQGQFTFEFYINPKYVPEKNTTGPGQIEYKPGTILHLSSSYAISLVSGSSVDKNGIVDGFRLLLQCTQSADIPPDRFTFSPTSNIPTNNETPRDLAFISNDNVLKRNNWHHVAIRWFAPHEPGTFFVDGVEQGSFSIPRLTGSINPKLESLTATSNDEVPSVLCVGNFIEADNTSTANQLSRFFSRKVSSEEGLLKLNNSNEVSEPAAYTVNYPLNAEIHDLKIYNKFRTKDQLYSSSLNGITDLKDVVFYVPPFFTKESPTRSNLMLTLDNVNGFQDNTFVLKSSGITDNLTSVNFINDNLGYAAGYVDATDDVIIKTTDGGKTWVQLNSGGSRLNDILFYNEELGYVAGQDNTFAYSTDAGQKWTSVSINAGTTWNSLSAPTSTVVYAVGNNNTTFQVYKSTDSGATWSVTGTSTAPANVDYHSVDFVDASTGYIAGVVGPGGELVYKTTNGGTDWTATAADPGASQINDIHVYDATTLWAVNSSGIVYKTTDSGTSWTMIFQANNPLNSVHFISSQIGYIVGDSGEAWFTTDGFLSWTKIKTGTTENLTSVYALDRRVVYAVGDSGTVVKLSVGSLSSNTQPFNPFIMNNVAGYDLSLENYCRDFKTGRYPRLLHLSSSVVDSTNISTNTNLTANDFLYNQEDASASEKARSHMMIKRSLSIMPCDNGLFRPNFELLRSGSGDYIKTGSMNRFVDDLDSLNLSMISLRNVLSSAQDDPTKSKQLGTLEQLKGKFVNSNDPDFSSKLDGCVIGNKSLAQTGKVLPLYQLTNNYDFNATVVFDVNSIFYGKRISEKTLTLRNSDYSYLTGKHFDFVINDDGYGNLYRASCNTPHAKWNSIGSVFYNDGVIMLMSPHTTFFGQNNFTTTFKGEHNVHVLKINAIAQSGMLNSSSNPAYAISSASADINDQDQPFVYITGINFHDENLNVVAKTQFAQPVIKRTKDSYLFRSKLDF